MSGPWRRSGLLLRRPRRRRLSPRHPRRSDALVPPRPGPAVWTRPRKKRLVRNVPVARPRLLAAPARRLGTPGQRRRDLGPPERRSLRRRPPHRTRRLPLRQRKRRPPRRLALRRRLRRPHQPIRRHRGSRSRYGRPGIVWCARAHRRYRTALCCMVAEPPAVRHTSRHVHVPSSEERLWQEGPRFRAGAPACADTPLTRP